MPDFKDIVLKIKESDKPFRISVRDLMKSAGYYRRDKDVNRSVRQRLRNSRLTTDPDFELVNIETRVQILPIGAQKPEKSTKHEVGNVASTEAGNPSKTDLAEEEREVVLTIGHLPSAVRTPNFIKRDETVLRAITIMLQQGVDHLIVSQNNRNPEGLITWSSLGRAQAGRRKHTVVSECMEPEPYVVSYNAPLFDAVREITRRGIAVVLSPTKTIGGSVTTNDIAEQFVTLSEPFLFIEQIENHLRALLRSAKLPLQSLQDLVDPRDEARKANTKSIDNLSFGETLRAFEQPETWEKMSLNLDRKTVVERLKKVNEIRNRVMHFHPDGISDEDREILRLTRKMLQIL